MTERLLVEIANPAAKRLDVAKVYGLALRSRDNTDWPQVNRAIIQRWSVSALVWIKQKAWKSWTIEL